MDCNDVRVLWALGCRGDAIDPTERAAIQQHLDACPDCAAHTRSEQAVDAAFAGAMRAVTVPSRVKSRVLAKLAADRPRTWPKALAAAAMLLLAIGGIAYLCMPSRKSVDGWDVYSWASRHGDPPETVRDWFKEQGVEMAALPDQLPHAYLWNYGVGEFKGRRVARLVFFNAEKNAVADVLVLSTALFDTHELAEGPDVQNTYVVYRHSEENYVYLIDTNDLKAFNQNNPAKVH
jgi:hypothetical protein